MLSMLKIKKYILRTFQNITQSVFLLLMIPKREGWYYIAVKNNLFY